MQGCTTCIKPSQGCVDLAKDNAMLGCHKVAATMLQPCSVWDMSFISGGEWVEYPHITKLIFLSEMKRHFYKAD